MAETKKTEQSTQEKNFDAARETAQINHDNEVQRNTVGGNDGVEVRDLQAVEVINPVRNSATGELEDDTRTLKQSHEEALGVDDGKSKSDSAPAKPAAKPAETKTETK